MALPSMFLQRPAMVDTAPTSGPYGLTDADLIQRFKDCKREAFDGRWVWERGWMRNIHYVSNRQWITYLKRSNEWVDVKLAKWLPKPVINKLGEGVMALRAMFASVNIGVTVRPVGSEASRIAVAATADEYSPLLHEEHAMDAVMNEADYWFITTGNTFLHTYFDRDVKYGVTEDPQEMCTVCQAVAPSSQLADAQQQCPTCGAPGPFVPAMDQDTGEPLPPNVTAEGKGVTVALSPFELAFPNSYARFEDVPYVIRLRWRTKTYYENHPQLKAQTAQVAWSKAPSETSLQLFRSLPHQADFSVGPFLGGTSGSGTNDELGAPEYEVWYRPCHAYPQGLVWRVLGDSHPIVLHLEEDEAIPGPIPYRDVTGKPLFMFSHAPFEQRGGRVYGTSPLDSVIAQQNMLNQLWSFLLLIVNRVSNPLWLVPKGAEIDRFTGAPGLIVEWNPLTVGGNAKPERLDGQNIPASLFTLEDKITRNIEEGLGTFDIIKGQKPAGVEAFAAMQLLVERSQSRFASAFKARGHLYRDWFKFALEIEREFGPDQRIQALLSPAKTWTRKQFDRANLQGSFEVIVEDGSNTPKTLLGERASIEHLNSLGFIDPTDPDQRYAIFQKFGQTRLSPALDVHMQSALRKQQAFEDWAENPEAQQVSLQMAQQELQQYQQALAAVPPPPPLPVPAMLPDGTPLAPVMPAPVEPPIDAAFPPPPNPTTHTPLAWKPWYHPRIHRQEFLKWMNSDRMVEMLQTNPALGELATVHLQDIDLALAKEAAQLAGPAPAPPVAQGAGRAMKNSNQEAGGVQTAESQ